MKKIKSIKIYVSVFGRFHAFEMAEQFFKNDNLKKLFTTYPYFALVKSVPINKRFVKSNSLIELIWRIGRETKIYYLKKKINFFLKIFNDFIVSIQLNKNTDFFIGWSNHSLISLQKSKRIGITTILERGSSHILEQKSLLKEEFEKNNIPFLFSDDHTNRELKEYEIADFISVPSEFVKDSFIKRGFKEEKLILNPYGVNLKIFKKEPKNDSIFRFIFVGNFSIRKGSHYLLQALYELDLQDSEFWQIGNLPEEISPYLNKFKRPNMKFFGIKPQNKLYSYLSQANVFVLPSLEEGLALVIPQAMSCGLPVICTFNSGGSSIVENEKQGFIVPIRDVESLKEKLLFMYNNQSICEEMGLNALKKVETGFSWDDYGKRYINNLESILKRKKITFC